MRWTDCLIKVDTFDDPNDAWIWLAKEPARLPRLLARVAGSALDVGAAESAWRFAGRASVEGKPRALLPGCCGSGIHQFVDRPGVRRSRPVFRSAGAWTHGAA